MVVLSVSRANGSAGTRDAEITKAGRIDRHRARDDDGGPAGLVEGLAAEDRPAGVARQVDVEQDERWSKPACKGG